MNTPNSLIPARHLGVSLVPVFVSEPRQQPMRAFFASVPHVGERIQTLTAEGPHRFWRVTEVTHIPSMEAITPEGGKRMLHQGNDVLAEVKVEPWNEP